MSARKPDRPRYVLVLQPLPRVDGIKALRRALKYLLRACGLKCLSIEASDAAEEGLVRTLTRGGVT